jgi:hypothetical protein
MKELYQYCRGLGGYIQDLYRIATVTFSNPHSFTKFLVINRLRKRTGATVLIEAGTYRGVTSARCSCVFDRVYTIELDTKLAGLAKTYLARRKNVTVIQGNALQVIPELLKNRELKNVLLFLDGHFSGGETACGDIPEPAAEELKLVAAYKDKIRAIVIDDFRSFGTEPTFPKKSDLLKSAEELFGSAFNIAVFLDQLIITPKTEVF